MIIFYPEKIELWEKSGRFDFSPTIQLVAREKTNHKGFFDRDDLMGFCKSHGVRFDDPKHPFKIEGPCVHPTLGPGTYMVHQHILLGWIKDDFR